jgi:hypothetical protein
MSELNQIHQGKVKLMNRLFDRGVLQPMPSVSKQIVNDRPLTAKIAIQAIMKAQIKQPPPEDVNKSRLPPINQGDMTQFQSNRPVSMSRNARRQVIHQRGLSQGTSSMDRRG